MFSLFINNLIKYLELKLTRAIFGSTEISDLLAIIFADDISIFFLSDTVTCLQRLINEIEIFCKQ